MGIAWALLVAAGFVQLMSFSAVPGMPAATPSAWPVAAELSRNLDRPTLVMFLHPRCPCSAATLSELERILPVINGRVDVHLNFLLPSERPAEWARARHWRRAVKFPGVRLRADDAGREAARFGARTSGETFLFTPSGELIFRGGITPARGHEGDSVGKQAILAYFRGERGAADAKTFGCAIHAESAVRQEL